MRLWPFAISLISVSLGASAAEIAGVKLDEQAKLGTSELVLNGAGLRKKVCFKVYVASLYLTERKKSPAEVLALGGPKRVSITLMRNLPAQDLVDALNGGIRDNSSPEERQALRGRIGELTATMLALRQGKRGDVITVDWLPDEGTLVLVNGKPKGKPIPGDDLYRALLKVWLGDDPSSARLKKALLGQTR
jgi:Chalcone isomerase-like